MLGGISLCPINNGQVPILHFGLLTPRLGEFSCQGLKLLTTLYNANILKVMLKTKL